VLKLTSDESEALFVAICLREQFPWPEGITQYLAAYELGVDSEGGQRFWGLWREAAHGFDAFGPVEAQTVALWRTAHGFDRWPDPAADYAAGLFQARHENTPGWEKVVAAAAYYDRLGLHISDIHSRNVGYVPRGGKDVLVITDPGRMIFTNSALMDKYEDFEVPKLADEAQSKYALPSILANPKRRRRT
jgi:hypothetical protein